MGFEQRFTGNQVAKYKNVDVSGAATNVLIAAVSGKKLRVLAMSLVSDGVGTIYLQDNASTPVTLFGGTQVVPLDPAGSAGGYSLTLPFNPLGWFETTAGKQLSGVTTGAGVKIVGCIVYQEVD